MSTASVVSASGSPRREPSGRRLHVVDTPRPARRPRLLYGIVAVAGAFLIGAAQMSLSILTTQTSYEVSRLAQEQRQLSYDKQMLYDAVAGLSSPQYLAANASALGMVIAESPSYLRLSDAAILGTGGAAVGGTAIDAIGRGAVANALITETPLVTEPDATIDGVPLPTPSGPVDPATGGVANTPPPITDGLPTPSTH